MTPAQPPFPTAWNLPFQPFVGSHTSILMSESVLGVSVAATRQNDGRFAYGLAPPPPRRPPSGGTNVPGATTSARLIVPAFKAAPAKLSHVAADARVAATAVRNNASAMTTFIVRSPVPGPQWLPVHSAASMVLSHAASRAFLLVTAYCTTTNLPIASRPDVRSCGANATNLTSLTSIATPSLASGG